MRIWSRILVLCLAATLAATLAACTPQRPATPKETFMTYIKALKAKDYTAMKVLLSSETIKMHEKEAKAQGVTVDDIVKRETLVGEGQTSVEYKNEKIDGDKASLQVKNAYGSWENVPFVREDGVWKIDKQGYMNEMQKSIDDETDRRIDEMINSNRSY